MDLAYKALREHLWAEFSFKRSCNVMCFLTENHVVHVYLLIPILILSTYLFFGIPSTYHKCPQHGTQYTAKYLLWIEVFPGSWLR